MLQSNLPADVSRILFVKHLPYNFSNEDMYNLFGRYGAVRQIRVGNTPSTKGRAYVVYEDIHDARQAVAGLNGYNVGGLYLTVLYHKPERAAAAAAAAVAAAAATAATAPASDQAAVEASRAKTAQGRAELEALKAKYGVSGSAPAAAAPTVG